ncbi:hypothetical protein GCM10027195_08290 [Comamonas sediminis]
MADAQGRIGGKAQPAIGMVAGDELVQARLMDGDLAGLQRGDLGRIDIDTQHLVANIGQHGTLNKTDIAGSKNSDFHTR